MKKLKLLALSGAALLLISPAFADDYGFSNFGDDTITSSNSLADDSSSFGSFDTSIFGGEASSDDSSALNITGETELTARIYLRDKNNLNSGETNFIAGETYYNPSLKLDLSYSAANSDLNGSILLSNESIMNHQEDILNEITYRAYTDNFVFQAGKTKIVWGRGDKVHVLDLLNANDFTSFIIPDYIDRRIAEPEMDLTWNIPSNENLSLQLVFTPTMSVDRFDTTGRWNPQKIATTRNTITNYVLTKIAAAPTTDAKLMLAKHYANEDVFYANINNLKYSQYGLRMTATMGDFDFGAQYYLGHYKTPSVKDITAAINLDYDKLQVFGIDTETVMGAYTMRGELAYYLTDDVEGDDYSTHNNSIQWVAGFDRNLPWGNLNVNIQEIGYYILNFNKVQNNVASALSFDMDMNKANRSTNNKIIVKLSDTLMHENLKPSLALLYSIESSDLVIMPEVSYIVKDGFKVTANANFVFSDTKTGEYSEYTDNSELQLKASYSF